MSKTLTIQFPDLIIELLGLSPEELEESLKKMIVLELVRKGRLSSGKAAELLGMSRWEFMDLMTEYNVPMTDLTSEELDEQLEILRNIKVELPK